MSTDNTLKIVEKINDVRIKCYSYEKKGRVALNFENALKKSTGDIIFLSDQDDIWNVNKTEICVEILKNYDLIIHNAKIDDRNFFKENGIRKSILKNLYKTSFLGCCMCFKKEVLRKALPFPQGFDTDKKPKMHGHDTWIGMVALLDKKVKFLNECLIFYRRHEDNVSESFTKSKRTLLEKLEWRKFLATELLKRK
ncbi:MAG: glycosyltransferase [Fusobacteriaceae bacterium]